MFTTLFFAGIMCQTIHDAGTIMQGPYFEKGTVSDDGKLYYQSAHYIYGWNQNLERVVDIKTPYKDYEIGSYFPNSEYIVASIFHDEDFDLKTVILGFKGDVLAEVPIFATQFRKIKEQLYCFNVNLEKDPPYFDGQYPYQYQPIKLSRTQEGFILERQGLPLFKATPLVTKFNFSFKDSWGIYKKGLYYFVNELEPKVWIVSPSDAFQKYKEGASTPGNLDSLPLKLENFNPFTEWLQPNINVMKVEEWKQTLKQHWLKHSFIHRFQTYGNGYLIAYSYPQCDEKESCRNTLLALQKFDSQFQPIGKPLVTTGIILGAIGPKVYILRFKNERTEGSMDDPTKASIVVINAL